MKKTITIVSIIVCTVVASVAVSISVFSHAFSSRYPIVLEALSHNEAQQTIEKNENAYLFRFSYSAGLDYEIQMEDGTWVSVIPADSDMWFNNQLSPVLANGENILLVIGTIEPADGAEAWRMLPPEYYLSIEQWFFVAPIHRDYTYEQHSRFFYPKDSLDQYDVDNGDYTIDGSRGSRGTLGPFASHYNE